MIAYVEAVGKLDQPSEQVRLLSLGTGTGHRLYGTRPFGGTWGLATGWKSRQIVDLIFNLQTLSATNMATLLLKDRYLRISFDDKGRLPLDDPKMIPQLRAKAAETFTYQFQRIKSFLEL
jgi:hypothetical protein